MSHLISHVECARIILQTCVILGGNLLLTNFIGLLLIRFTIFDFGISGFRKRTGAGMCGEGGGGEVLKIRGILGEARVVRGLLSGVRVEVFLWMQSNPLWM
jgi:hypothetical protein